VGNGRKAESGGHVGLPLGLRRSCGALPCAGLLEQVGLSRSSLECRARPTQEAAIAASLREEESKPGVGSCSPSRRISILPLKYAPSSMVIPGPTMSPTT